MTPQFTTAVEPKTLGHLALHYRPGESNLVIQLFRSLGLRVEDFGKSREALMVQDEVTLPHDDRAFRVFPTPGSSGGFFFVCTATQAQLALEDALKSVPAATLKEYQRGRADNPETCFHIGIRYATLEDLERAVLTLERAVADDPTLRGRVQISRLKAHSGTDPSIAVRMAASPVLKSDDRDAYGEGIVQIFVETDIAAGGLMKLGQIIELDYVFPNRTISYPPEKVYEPL